MDGALMMALVARTGENEELLRSLQAQHRQTYDAVLKGFEQLSRQMSRLAADADGSGSHKSKGGGGDSGDAADTDSFVGSLGGHVASAAKRNKARQVLSSADLAPAPDGIRNSTSDSSSNSSVVERTHLSA